MGSHLLTKRIDGNPSIERIRKLYDAQVASDLSEFGHDSYSGSWATVRGGVRDQRRRFLTWSTWDCVERGNRLVDVETEHRCDSGIFPSLAAAFDYVEDNAEKWGAALVVNYRRNGRKNGRVQTLLAGRAAS